MVDTGNLKHELLNQLRSIMAANVLREEHRPNMLENWVLRKVFETRGEEVTGEWRGSLFTCTYHQIL
jgi:hypothetical protein